MNIIFKVKESRRKYLEDLQVLLVTTSGPKQEIHC
jgi:hypothetical protein